MRRFGPLLSSGVVAGVACFGLAAGVGAHTLAATYRGNGHYLSSASPKKTLTVAK